MSVDSTRSLPAGHPRLLRHTHASHWLCQHKSVRTTDTWLLDQDDLEAMQRMLIEVELMKSIHKNLDSLLGGNMAPGHARWTNVLFGASRGHGLFAAVGTASGLGPVVLAPTLSTWLVHYCRKAFAIDWIGCKSNKHQ